MCHNTLFFLKKFIDFFFKKTENIQIYSGIALNNLVADFINYNLDVSPGSIIPFYRIERSKHNKNNKQ